ncbi:HNH endonuclease family protein [Ruania zhangjianzhongii]|uniref:HNH endonuclease family protein n=1 Tax=Ruania zhangjianzhongii TaxID=2603206 RepID=UPI0011C8F038|nr:DUF262 domain-containing protein [Ruania zhangjianzhongii]
MKIEPIGVTVGEVAAGFVDNQEEGVVAYDGLLNVRPPYQREFVYKTTQRDLVINTIRNGYPLNVMYWAQNDDGTIEVLDGQQRTISFCQYVAEHFSVDVDGNPKGFHNLSPTQRQQILDYELMVYLCEGTEEEKLAWFEIVNIAGETLTEQELRNAIYTGPWLAHAKRIFSRPGGPAYQLASKYVTGSPIRQELLEKAIDWVSPGQIKDYMQVHQHDPDAQELWDHFQAVIDWVMATFSVYRGKEMKRVDWGDLFRRFGETEYDPDAMEARVSELMQDLDVDSHPGIYEYVLDGDERHLKIRKFDDRQRREAYERQRGLCANGDRCKTPGNSDGKKKFGIEEMDADHIVPWSKGGRTIPENCQMLCVACNRSKGDF